ncbi:MAG: DNA polymerase III subunit alpha, partial [Phycisphaerae bacterium]
YLEGFYYRPRIDREVLARHAEGLICISGHMGTELTVHITSGNVEAAREAAEFYRELLGPENFVIELQRRGLAEQERRVGELLELARQVDVPVVATNDVHYLSRDEAFVHEVMVCINTGKTLQSADRMRMESDQLYLKSPAEMCELFADLPEACANTVAIAERCNVEIEFGRRHAPVFRPPDGKSDDQYLWELVYAGGARRYGRISESLRERIDYELDVIASRGFSSYFLIVNDFVGYARSRGIPAAARGSGCSTVVGYCLGISAPDPLRYGLYFERFMDPERNEMPDIDIDICQVGRAEVIDYVRRKYGHVAQIITFGTLKARAAIRDVCRVLDVPLAEADRIAKLVPDSLNMTISRALAEEPELQRRCSQEPAVGKVIEIARRLEGLARHASVHAAGVVIADKPLEQFLPLYKTPDSDVVITQFDGAAVEKIGLLKMDFLGLRTLTTLERARQLVRQNHGVEIDLESLELEDPRVYELFASGQTKGIFQFESAGMRDVVTRMKPNRIEDLIAANALYRPGPMINIDAYIARKHGQAWSTPHPVMSQILQETYGIMLYQEQVSRLVNRLGGIELKRAFRLAKAISKKRSDLIEQQREPFLQGCRANGLDRATAEQIFDDILRFGGYAFNKAHSTGYALVAYQTAYMKAYYPLEFMAALLSFEMGNTNKIVEYIDECRRMGITVKPPDVNSSLMDFTVVYPQRPGVGTEGPGQAERGHIRFGLGAVKGLGQKAVEAIIEAREEGGAFRDIYDFCERVDLTVVNRAAVEALIKCGAFDSTGAMRKALMEVLERALAAGAELQRDRRAGQSTMFGMFQGAGGRSSARPQIPDSEWSESQMLAYEKATLGFYITAHPLSQHAELLEKYATAETVELAALPGETEVVLGGMIAKVRTTTTRSGRNAGAKMAFLTLEDLKGAAEAVVFPDDLQRFRSLIEPERLVFLVGRVDRRRDQPSLRVSEVIDAEHVVERLTESVLLRIDCSVSNEQTLARLRQLCQAHPGRCPLLLEMTASDGLTVTIRCDGQVGGVCPNERFVAAVGELLGQHCVVLVSPRRRLPPAEPPQPPEPLEDESSLELEADVLQ